MPTTIELLQTIIDTPLEVKRYASSFIQAKKRESLFTGRSDKAYPFPASMWQAYIAIFKSQEVQGAHPCVQVPIPEKPYPREYDYTLVYFLKKHCDKVDSQRLTQAVLKAAQIFIEQHPGSLLHEFMMLHQLRETLSFKHSSDYDSTTLEREITVLQQILQIHEVLEPKSNTSLTRADSIQRALSLVPSKDFLYKKADLLMLESYHLTKASWISEPLKRQAAYVSRPLMTVRIFSPYYGMNINNMMLAQYPEFRQSYLSRFHPENHEKKNFRFLLELSAVQKCLSVTELAFDAQTSITLPASPDNNRIEEYDDEEDVKRILEAALNGTILQPKNLGPHWVALFVQIKTDLNTVNKLERSMTNIISEMISEESIAPEVLDAWFFSLKEYCQEAKDPHQRPANYSVVYELLKEYKQLPENALPPNMPVVRAETEDAHRSPSSFYETPEKKDDRLFSSEDNTIALVASGIEGAENAEHAQPTHGLGYNPSIKATGSRSDREVPGDENMGLGKISNDFIKTTLSPVKEEESSHDESLLEEKFGLTEEHLKQVGKSSIFDQWGTDVSLDDSGERKTDDDNEDVKSVRSAVTIQSELYTYNDFSPNDSKFATEFIKYMENQDTSGLISLTLDWLEQAKRGADPCLMPEQGVLKPQVGKLYLTIKDEQIMYKTHLTGREPLVLLEGNIAQKTGDLYTAIRENNFEALSSRTVNELLEITFAKRHTLKEKLIVSAAGEVSALRKELEKKGRPITLRVAYELLYGILQAMIFAKKAMPDRKRLQEVSNSSVRRYFQDAHATLMLLRQNQSAQKLHAEMMSSTSESWLNELTYFDSSKLKLQQRQLFLNANKYGQVSQSVLSTLPKRWSGIYLNGRDENEPDILQNRRQIEARCADILARILDKEGTEPLSIEEQYLVAYAMKDYAAQAPKTPFYRAVRLLATYYKLSEGNNFVALLCSEESCSREKNIARKLLEKLAKCFLSYPVENLLNEQKILDLSLWESAKNVQPSVYFSDDIQDDDTKSTTSIASHVSKISVRSKRSASSNSSHIKKEDMLYLEFNMVWSSFSFPEKVLQKREVELILEKYPKVLDLCNRSTDERGEDIKVKTYTILNKVFHYLHKILPTGDKSESAPDDWMSLVKDNADNILVPLAQYCRYTCLLTDAKLYEIQLILDHHPVTQASADDLACLEISVLTKKHIDCIFRNYSELLQQPDNALLKKVFDWLYAQPSAKPTLAWMGGSKQDIPSKDWEALMNHIDPTKSTGSRALYDAYVVFMSDKKQRTYEAKFIQDHASNSKNNTMKK